MGMIKVKALRTGYYNNQRYKPGEVFMVADHMVSFDRRIEVKDKRTGEIVVRNHKGWMTMAAEDEPLTNKKKQEDPYHRTKLSHELDVV